MKPKSGLAILMGIMAAYYLHLIYTSSVLVGRERYFLPYDDVIITMSYARTLVRTGELDWYPGAQRVEGVTSPLWAMFLAGLQLIPVTPAQSGGLVQLLGLVILVCTLPLVYRFALFIAGDTRLALVSTAVVALCYPLIHVALAGWEYSLFALLAVALVYVALARSRWPWYGDLLIAIGLLTRMDFLVIVVVVAAYLIWRRKVHWWRVLSIVALTIGGLTFWRWRYYGALLPNTWTLKMTGYPTGLRVARGAWVTLTDIWRWNTLVVLLPFAALVPRRLRTEKYALPCCIFAGQAAYAVWVGGDVWHNEMLGSRYLISALPVFLPVALAVLDRVARDLIQENTATAARRAWPSLVAAALVIAHLSPLDRLARLLPTQLGSRVGAIRQALWIRKEKPDCTVGVVTAGVVPYFSERPSVDFLGKSDTVIAKTEAHRAPPGVNPLTYFRPGHLKWNTQYSVGYLRPDVIVGVWRDREDWYELMEQNNYRLVSPESCPPLFVRQERSVNLIQR
jgi:hypothetical protein